jgi:hypothetical protein
LLVPDEYSGFVHSFSKSFSRETMTTFANLIARYEGELSAAEGRAERSKAEAKLILDVAQKQGRSQMTKPEDERLDVLFASVESAQADARMAR